MKYVKIKLIVNDKRVNEDILSIEEAIKAAKTLVIDYGWKMSDTSITNSLEFYRKGDKKVIMDYGRSLFGSTIAFACENSENVYKEKEGV